MIYFIVTRKVFVGYVIMIITKLTSLKVQSKDEILVVYTVEGFMVAMMNLCRTNWNTCTPVEQ